MNENLLDDDVNIISTSIKTEESKFTFDFKGLSSPLKEHFEINGLLLVLFINPISGSQEGNTILNLSQK